MQAFPAPLVQSPVMAQAAPGSEGKMAYNLTSPSCAQCRSVVGHAAGDAFKGFVQEKPGGSVIRVFLWKWLEKCGRLWRTPFEVTVPPLAKASRVVSFFSRFRGCLRRNIRRYRRVLFCLSSALFPACENGTHRRSDLCQAVFTEQDIGAIIFVQAFDAW